MGKKHMKQGHYRQEVAILLADQDADPSVLLRCTIGLRPDHARGLHRILTSPAVSVQDHSITTSA